MKEVLVIRAAARKDTWLTEAIESGEDSSGEDCFADDAALEAKDAASVPMVAQLQEAPAPSLRCILCCRCHEYVMPARPVAVPSPAGCIVKIS